MMRGDPGAPCGQLLGVGGGFGITHLSFCGGALRFESRHGTGGGARLEVAFDEGHRFSWGLSHKYSCECSVDA